MKYINLLEQKKAKLNAITIIESFLKCLPGTLDVSRTVKDKSVDLELINKSKRKIKITVFANKRKDSDLFINTYNSYSSQERGRVVKMHYGKIYNSTSHFIFYLTDNLLYILPMHQFREWVDRNSDVFLTECYYYKTKGYEVRMHGLMVPIERILKDFAKGNSNVKVYYLQTKANNQMEYVRTF